MATNAQGYPYPVGTDRVMDGDDAIKALADAVGTKLGSRICTGQAQAVFSASATANVNITFPAGAFAAGSVPRILVSIAVASSQYFAVAGPPTASGCGISAVGRAGTNLSLTATIDWLAYQA